MWTKPWKPSVLISIHCLLHALSKFIPFPKASLKSTVCSIVYTLRLCNFNWIFSDPFNIQDNEWQLAFCATFASFQLVIKSSLTNKMKRWKASKVRCVFKKKKKKKHVLQCLFTIWLTVFASVDLQCQRGERDPSPEHLPDPAGCPIHPGQPSVLV